MQQKELILIKNKKQMVKFQIIASAKVIYILYIIKLYLYNAQPNCPCNVKHSQAVWRPLAIVKCIIIEMLIVVDDLRFISEKRGKVTCSVSSLSYYTELGKNWFRRKAEEAFLLWFSLIFSEMISGWFPALGKCKKWRRASYI